MNVKNVTLAALMAIASHTNGLKAQIFSKLHFDIYTEIGITGASKKSFDFYRGVNIGVKSEKNYFNTFLGASVNADKDGCFQGLVTDDFRWRKHSNFSSWTRAIFTLSERVKKFTLEISPVKLNIPLKKMNFSLHPAFALQRDFKSKNTALGINTVFQSTYSVTPKDKFYFEIKHCSNPLNKVKNKDCQRFLPNIVYMMTYKKYF